MCSTKPLLGWGELTADNSPVLEMSQCHRGHLGGAARDRRMWEGENNARGQHTCKLAFERCSDLKKAEGEQPGTEDNLEPKGSPSVSTSCGRQEEGLVVVNVHARLEKASKTARGTEHGSGRCRRFTTAIPGISDLPSSTSQVLDYRYEPPFLMYALPGMEARAC